MPQTVDQLLDTLAGVLQRSDELPPLAVVAVASAYDALVDPAGLPPVPSPVPCADAASALAGARAAALAGVGDAADPWALALAARHLGAACAALGRDG